MCGINGAFNTSNLPAELADKGRLRRSVREMSQRGPDGEGFFLDERCFLGHTRLSIIDLSGGAQPMIGGAGRFVVTFNGEIFNFRDLRGQLGASGAVFRTTSDTEALLESYIRYGERCVDHLNGDFAFAIYDRRERTMFLARDRMGVKPLYYSIRDGTLYFASTVRSLLGLSGIPPRLNTAAIKQLANFWSPLGESTFFEGVRALEPGRSLLFKDGGANLSRYWDLKFEPSAPQSERRWIEAVAGTLEDAVGLRQTATDVPIGFYLSGGLDSSILLALGKRQAAGSVRSFSVQFESAEHDESGFQAEVAEFLGIENSSVRMGNSQIGSEMEAVVEAVEAPIFRTAPVPMYLLARQVRDAGYKVVIAGEGADEVAWGYDIFKENVLREALLKGENTAYHLSKLPALYPYLSHFNSRYVKLLEDFYRGSVSNPDSLSFSHRTRMRGGESLMMSMSEDLLASVADHDVEGELARSLPKEFTGWSLLQKTQYLEMKTLLAGYLLSAQGDRVAMANSVEVRYPFLDHRVVEVFSKVPDTLKLRDYNEKFLLKQVFGSILPPRVVHRPKQPYRAPEGAAILAVSGSAERLMESVQKWGLFNSKVVAKIIARLEGSSLAQQNFGENFAFVTIYTLHLFLERFFDTSRVPPGSEKPLGIEIDERGLSWNRH